MNKKIIFKRLNALKFAKENGCCYHSVDLLKQTSIEYLVNIYASKGFSKGQIIAILVNGTKQLLNAMIIEKEVLLDEKNRHIC